MYFSSKRIHIYIIEWQCKILISYNMIMILKSVCSGRRSKLSLFSVTSHHGPTLQSVDKKVNNNRAQHLHILETHVYFVSCTVYHSRKCVVYTCIYVFQTHCLTFVSILDRLNLKLTQVWSEIHR